MPKNKKPKQSRSKIIYLKYGFVILTFFIAISAVMMSLFTFKLHLELQDQTNHSIKYLVTEAVDGLLRQMPQSPAENKQYLQEMRLRFDLNSAYDSLLYEYTQAYEGSPEFVAITNNTLLKSGKGRVWAGLSTEDTLKEVPGLQSCSRIYLISFDSSEPQLYATTYELINTKPINDKSIYIWRINQNEKCLMYDAETQKQIESIILTAELY